MPATKPAMRRLRLIDHGHFTSLSTMSEQLMNVFYQRATVIEDATDKQISNQLGNEPHSLFAATIATLPSGITGEDIL
jgi:hypothetical protein